MFLKNDMYLLTPNRTFNLIAFFSEQQYLVVICSRVKRLANQNKEYGYESIGNLLPDVLILSLNALLECSIAKSYFKVRKIRPSVKQRFEWT